LLLAMLWNIFRRIPVNDEETQRHRERETRKSSRVRHKAIQWDCMCVCNVLEKRRRERESVWETESERGRLVFVRACERSVVILYLYMQVVSTITAH
jgi:hypothetical protein